MLSLHGWFPILTGVSPSSGLGSYFRLCFFLRLSVSFLLLILALLVLEPSLSSFPRCAEEAGAILILDLISISEWHIILLTVNKPHAQALIKKAQLEQLLPL